MADGEKWETVAGKSKKPASKAKQNGKAVDRKFVEAIEGPVIENKTLFGALSPKERKPKTGEKTDGSGGQAAGEKKSGIPRLQKKDGSAKKPHPSKLKLETYVPTVCIC